MIPVRKPQVVSVLSTVDLAGKLADRLPCTGSAVPGADIMMPDGTSRFRLEGFRVAVKYAGQA
eukprot:2429659-Rhodomonas_salina.2